MSKLITGNLIVRGDAYLEEMLVVNGRPIADKKEHSVFIPTGTYYRMDPGHSTAQTSVYSANPVPTSPVLVDCSSIIPNQLKGLVVALDIQVQFYGIGTNGAIWMTKRRGETGSGDDWTRHGWLYHGPKTATIGLRWHDTYLIPTDANGDFEIWNHSSSLWTTRIDSTYIRGIYTKA